LDFSQKRKREVAVVLVLGALDHLHGVDEGLIHIVGEQDQDQGGARDGLVLDQGGHSPDPNGHVPDHETGREGPGAQDVVVEVIQDLDLIAEDAQDLNQGGPILNQNPAQKVMRSLKIKRMTKEKRRMIKRIRKMRRKKKRKMIRKKKTPRKKVPKGKVIQK
jgi:hypothetical protein